MLESINEFFSQFPNWMHILFISFIPVIELRGAIPYGILILHMNLIEVLLLSIAGSALPAPIILFLGEKILTAMSGSKIRLVNSLGNKITSHSLKKKGKLERYGYFGLFLFIAIPLPGTGVWTGSVIAALLGLKPVKSIFSAFAGTAAAGIIVTLLVQGGRILVSI